MLDKFVSLQQEHINLLIIFNGFFLYKKFLEL